VDDGESGWRVVLLRIVLKAWVGIMSVLPNTVYTLERHGEQSALTA
jgi:hypothetical protein